MYYSQLSSKCVRMRTEPVQTLNDNDNDNNNNNNNNNNNGLNQVVYEYMYDTWNVILRIRQTHKRTRC